MSDAPHTLALCRWIQAKGGRAPALVADGLVVDHDLICEDGYTALGGVRLVGAQIKGELRFDNVVLFNENGVALAAASLTVDRDMWFVRSTARGEVAFVGARIGNSLDFTKADLANLGGMALDLESVRAARLVLMPAHDPFGGVDLTNAEVGRLYDDLSGSVRWVRASPLLLTGFTYGAFGDDTLGDSHVKVRARLRWLRRNQHGYTPQLYEQLAAAYRRSGRDDAARRVMIAKEWRRRRRLNPVGKVWNLLLWAVVGYGYRAGLAALWLGALVGVGTWAFDSAHRRGDLVPTAASVPEFQPAIFALDTLLPIVRPRATARVAGPRRRIAVVLGHDRVRLDPHHSGGCRGG